MRSVRAAIAKCPAYDEVDTGTKVRDELSVVPVAPLGDESLGLRVVGVSQGHRIELLIELVRSGHTLITVAEGTFDNPGSQPRVEQLARTTLARIR